VSDDGLAESEKSGCVAEVTVSVAEALCVSAPLTPVTVRGYDPAAVPAPTVTVKVVELPLAGFGLKLPVAPAGSPLTEKLIAELNPPLGVMPTA
jgi:hypothetical protein